MRPAQSSRRRLGARRGSSSSPSPWSSRRRNGGPRERNRGGGAPRSPPRPQPPGRRGRAPNPGRRPEKLPPLRSPSSRRGGRVNRLPQESQMPVTSPSGLVVNRSGPPQFRHGRARGPSDPARSDARKPPRRGGPRNSPSDPVRRTNSNAVLHPVHRADNPSLDAAISRGAPHRLQGGPPGARASSDPSSPSDADAPVDGGARPPSTVPSTRV